mmetsp:Transcript_19663/g.45842  ORF Transcript_19663/g.45842 Transcript_19663/m.45842 type:complete len:321 (+) Transcript_19663:70-1032(+)
MAAASFDAAMFGGSVAEVMFKTAVLRPFLHHQGVEGGRSFLKANNHRGRPCATVQKPSCLVQPFAETHSQMDSGGCESSSSTSPRLPAHPRKSRSPLPRVGDCPFPSPPGTVPGSPVLVTSWGSSSSPRRKNVWVAARSCDAQTIASSDFMEEPDDPRVMLPAHRIGDELPDLPPKFSSTAQLPRKVAMVQSMPSIPCTSRQAQKLAVKGLHLPVSTGYRERLREGPPRLKKGWLTASDLERGRSRNIISGTSSRSLSSSCSRITLPTPGINHFPMMYDISTPRTQGEVEQDGSQAVVNSEGPFSNSELQRWSEHSCKAE